jgi:hypothetical protein
MFVAELRRNIFRASDSKRMLAGPRVASIARSSRYFNQAAHESRLLKQGVRCTRSERTVRKCVDAVILRPVLSESSEAWSGPPRTVVAVRSRERRRR